MGLFLHGVRCRYHKGCFNFSWWALDALQAALGFMGCLLWPPMALLKGAGLVGLCLAFSTFPCSWSPSPATRYQEAAKCWWRALLKENASLRTCASPRSWGFQYLDCFLLDFPRGALFSCLRQPSTCALCLCCLGCCVLACDAFLLLAPLEEKHYIFDMLQYWKNATCLLDCCAKL